MTTGKNKEQFEKWYIESLMWTIPSIPLTLTLNKFYKLPLSMQWGVYLEYYDSVGVKLEIISDGTNNWFSLIDELYAFSGYKETRQEAQKAALKKADEIVNERLRDDKSE